MILRTYGCESCGHTMTVELTAEQWNIDPPACPQCSDPTYQEFFPPAIGGGTYGKAEALAHTIAAEDYGVADLATSPSRGQTRYKDATPDILPSSWAGAAQGQLAQAIALGREVRLKHGSGLDVLQGALATGAQRDLIADSRKRSIKVY